MKTYPIPMVPGPVKAHPAVLEAYRVDYGSADLEKEYVELYTQTETNLKAILKTQSSVVIFLGEGMMALWGALKSCLAARRPGAGDRNGRLTATGSAKWRLPSAPRCARSACLTTKPFRISLKSENVTPEFKPKMITVVHCETPSGTLNPIDGLSRLKQEMGVPLLYVDAVSSIGGAPVLPDEWHIDLCLGGSQKCLSALPDTCFLSVSARAWEIIEQVNYVGYDAIKPFKTAVEKHYFPYTPGWQATAGLNAGAEAILKEGLEACFKRHAEVAAFCRQRLVEIGYSLFPAPNSQMPYATVTAANMPKGITWTEFDQRLRQHGLVVGGSYGPIAGKVFRIGHMGTQADMRLVKQALKVLEAEMPAS